jgi:hypothetical protein
MKRQPPPLAPEVQALLDHERPVPPLPAAVRARALARARAAQVAGDVRLPASTGAMSGVRWAAVAALTFVASAAIGAAAYEIRAHVKPAPAGHPAVLPAAPVAPVEVVVPPAAPSAPAAPIADVPPAPEPALAPAPAPAPGTPRLSRADAVRAELRLLRQARGAVARGDFAAALQPIAEHTHRFKDGRLAEEREALRVKALAGLGRTEEARRAAAAFAARFPRSVLLPAVKGMPASEP